MDKEYYDALAKVRMDRARELFEEATELLEKGSYKSANNRAFYNTQWSIKTVQLYLYLQRGWNLWSGRLPENCSGRANSECL